MTRTNLHDPEHSVPEWDVGRDLMHHGVINHNAMSYKIEEELNQCLS